LNRRVVVITIGLVGAGAIAGGTAAVFAGWLAMMYEAGPSGIGLHDLWEVGSFTFPLGAIFGSVMFPVAAWALLRRVPIGRALVTTALTTVVGAAIGEALAPFNPYHEGTPGIIWGGVVGFLAETLGLWLTSRSRRSSSSPISG